MTAAISLSVGAQTVLVDEDWQTDPLIGSGTTLTTEFPGWTFTSDAKARNENQQCDVPGDSAVTNLNQVVQLEQTTAYANYNISHNWDSNDVYYLKVEISSQNYGASYLRYIRPELRQQDETVLWSTVADSTTAIPLYSEFAYGTLSAWPSECTFWFTIDASTFTEGTEGQPIRLHIAHSGSRGAFLNGVKLTLGPMPVDNTPPAADPLTWEVVPTIVNYLGTTMKADSVRDDLYDVEYYFTNTVRGTSSGWQDSRTWSETGLDYNTTYTYRVKARDKSPNQNESTTWSSLNVTTPTHDLDPPSPDPVTWDAVPTVGDYGIITMTANAVTDVSGFEYYFENITKATNTGWQDSTTWTDGVLDPATLYTYRVKARDKSLDQNESTTWSSEESATTPAVPEGTLVISHFQSPLFADKASIVSGSFPGWECFTDHSDQFVKVRRGGTDGLPHDTRYSPNQGLHFEYTSAEVQYDISHNWAATDVFTLTLNAAPQSWSNTSQRYIRPSLRQQDGTVLWAPGENFSGPEKTALPVGVNFGSSNWQAESDDLEFTFTIDASTFTVGDEGQPIALRIDSSGGRGMFVDNVFLGLAQPEPASGTLIILR